MMDMHALSHAMPVARRKRWTNAWVAMLVSLAAVGSQAQSPAPDPTAPGVVPDPSATRWIARSTEAIQHPFLRLDQLPRTISIDPWTDEEIQRIRVEMYKTLPPKACVAWGFLSIKDKLQPISLTVNNEYSILKINGAIRRSTELYVKNFSPVQSLTQARDQELSPKGGAALENAAPVALYVDIGGRMERVAGSNRCTLMKAKCARYKSREFKIYWVSDAFRGEKRGRVQLRNDLNQEHSYFLEDMCPYTWRGVVDGPWNARAAGELPGKLLYGFWFNSSIQEALAEVANEAGR